MSEMALPVYQYLLCHFFHVDMIFGVCFLRVYLYLYGAFRTLAAMNMLKS